MRPYRTLVPTIASWLLLASPAARSAAPNAPEVPLVHATGTERFCARAFPAIPGQQVCIDLAFADTDLWVFRDSTALSVSSYESAGFAPAMVPPTTLATRVQRGSLPHAAFSSLQAALGSVPIGIAAGECNPLLPLVGVPPSFPQPDLHYRIVWYGKGFRTNVLELGTQFPEICPQPLQDLVTLLLDLPSKILPSPEAGAALSRTTQHSRLATWTGGGEQHVLISRHYLRKEPSRKLVPELAAAVVATLAPYLTAGGTEAAKKLGSAAAERLAGLYDKIKARLSSPVGQVALAAIEKAPETTEAQGTLRLAIEEELARNPAFHAELASLVEGIRSSPPATFQASSTIGDGNVNVQIAGPANQVGVSKPTV